MAKTSIDGGEPRYRLPANARTGKHVSASTDEGVSDESFPASVYRSPRSGQLRRRNSIQMIWFLYGKSLKERPLVTKAVNAFIISGLSNAVSQVISKRYRFKESFFYGLQCCPPYSHFVYKLMDHMFGEGPENSWKKVVFDQACWKPVITLYYFVLNGVLNGGGAARILQNIRLEYWKTLLDTWKVWPLISYCNQKYVPAHLRSVVLDVVAFFFDIMVSMRVALKD